MHWTVRILGCVADIYVALLAVLFAVQRRLMYFPSVDRPAVSLVGPPRATSREIATADGETIVAWYAPPVPGKPIFLYFHGNGGSLADRADALRRFASDGSGFLAIDYRGYGGSTGSPCEQGFIRDGEAAFREAVGLGFGPDRIVVVGESIGTGVAVAVAAEHAVRALVLDSAFSSAADVAAARFWMLPVRLLMSDTFDSAARIGRAGMPKLLLHGAEDMVIPPAFGRALFAAAPQPKTFVELHRRGHVMLFGPDVPGMVRTWLATIPPAGDRPSSMMR